MSLTELAVLTANTSPGFIAIVLSAILLVWLYIHSAAQLRLTRRQRLHELQDSLQVYGRLAGMLSAISDDAQRQDLMNGLIFRALQECKAAPYLTPHLQEQIQTSLRGTDISRLELLHKSLEREMNKLIEERRLILQETHAPSWGAALWKLLRPAAAPLTLVGIVWTLWRLLAELEIDKLTGETGWNTSFSWLRCISALIALVYLYRLLTLRRQNDLDVTASHVPTSLLAFLIAGTALFQWLGPEASPYILAVQLLLFVTGFRLTRGRSRSDRPYVGHLDLMTSDAAVHSDVHTAGSNSVGITTTSTSKTDEH